MADQTIRCCGCSNDFIFTEGEQAFFEEKCFQVPRRCKDCRDKRKAQQQQVAPPPAQVVPSDPPPDERRRPKMERRKGGRRDDRDER